MRTRYRITGSSPRETTHEGHRHRSPSSPRLSAARPGPVAVADANTTLTAVPGIKVGHHTLTERPDRLHGDPRRRRRRVGGVSQRGGAPGTRETDLLDPSNMVDKVNAVVLAGGSAFGLDAATGTVRWLEEHNIGWPTGVARVPIVPAAILFDLPVGGKPEDPADRRLRLPGAAAAATRARRTKARSAPAPARRSASPAAAADR